MNASVHHRMKKVKTKGNTKISKVVPHTTGTSEYSGIKSGAN